MVSLAVLAATDHEVVFTRQRDDDVRHPGSAAYRDQPETNPHALMVVGHGQHIGLVPGS
ncbi:hypothetical protein [Amycolatopsis sp. cmx-11-12]|uniref:hypothetical protein n=1 Tax=Amycolatopsis sp. cmx-11-12 TaxID=2785795 RepID=UPI003917FDBD